MVQNTIQHHRAPILNLLSYQRSRPGTKQHNCYKPTNSSSNIVTIAALCDTNAHLLSSKWQARTHRQRYELYNRTIRSDSQTYRHSPIRNGPTLRRFPIRNWQLPSSYGKPALFILGSPVITKYPLCIKPPSPQLIHWVGSIGGAFWSCLLWHGGLSTPFSYNCKLTTNPKSRDR